MRLPCYAVLPTPPPARVRVQLAFPGVTDPVFGVVRLRRVRTGDTLRVRMPWGVDAYTVRAVGFEGRRLVAHVMPYRPPAPLTDLGAYLAFRLASD